MNPADVNKNNQNGRKALKIFIILFICISIFISLYFLKDNILNFLGVKRPVDYIPTGSDSTEEVSESPFSNFVPKEDETITYTKLQLDNLEMALNFYTKLKSSNGDWESALEEGHALAEVVSSQDGTKAYNLVYSKNPSLNLKYNIGDALNFKPTLLNPDSLTVMEGRVVRFVMGGEYTDNFEENVYMLGISLYLFAKKIIAKTVFLSGSLF